MVVGRVVWNGTEEERRGLLAAMENNCACQFDAMGARTLTCESHAMLVKDQRALDGLLFVRRIRACLIREEESQT